MTTRVTKATKPAAAERKSNKLALSKKTLQDLTPRGGGAVRGGAMVTYSQSCSYDARAGCG